MTAEVKIAARSALEREQVAQRWTESANVVGFLFILPAAVIPLVFLAYPLARGFWLDLTDTLIGQLDRFVGLANFVSLAHDLVFWLSVLR